MAHLFSGRENTEHRGRLCSRLYPLYTRNELKRLLFWAALSINSQYSTAIIVLRAPILLCHQLHISAPPAACLFLALKQSARSDQLSSPISVAMDPDLHRQKRSRLASGAASQAEQAQSSSSRVSTTTSALQNLSVGDSDDQNSTQNAQQTPRNPTPPATFFGHPNLLQHGSATSRFSFNPAIDLNNSPPPSFPRTDSPARNPQDQFPSSLKNLRETSAQTEVSTLSTVLPIHQSRPIQPSSGLIAGPSSKQTKHDATYPLPQHPSKSSFIFPGNYLTHSPALPPTLNTSDEQSEAVTCKSSRPQPIYHPTLLQGKFVNPLAGNTSRISTSSPDTGRSLLDAHKEIASSFQKPTETSQSDLSPKHHQRLSDGRSTGSINPYPSIYPANVRQSYDDLETPHPRSPPGYPPNYYTSPNRVPNAAIVASRKRKRGWPAIAPEAHIYTRTNRPDFNIFGGILLYPELCFALAANLRVEDLISLYAISKDFHTIIDTRFATVVLSQSLRKCPESSRVYPFRCYKYLCRPDPAPRIPHPHPTKQAAGEIRKVPSFRWLRMVMFREKVCHEIVTIMAEDGVPLPSRCELALKRMWFLMDIPDNARRIGFMHSQKLITDLDLYFIMCFVVKLDLRFNDPTAPNRYHGLRKTLLTQRGLSPLWRALKRTTLSTRYDVLKMWVVAKYNPPPVEAGLPMFGLSGEKVGKMKMEYYGQKSTHDTGKPCTFLLRPDQLVMREIIRRKIAFSKHFLRCLLWGYADIVTLENYPPRTWDRRIKALVDEYEADDECGGCVATGDDDDLLDLAVVKPISMLVRQSGTATEESRTKQDLFLEECMRWFEDESKEIDTTEGH